MGQTSRLDDRWDLMITCADRTTFSTCRSCRSCRSCCASEQLQIARHSTTHVFVFADCITHRPSTQHDADCTTLVRSYRSYDTTSLNTVRCRSHDTICTSDHDALVVAADRVVCPSAQLVAVRTTHMLLVQIVSCVRPTCRRLHDTLGKT